MNISKLNDKQLHIETQNAFRKEKEATLHLLQHLIEIDRRKLFADFGYSSIQKYLIEELKYSEGESWTRVQAMRLIKQSKFAQDKIKNGELTLCNAALVQKQIKDSKTKEPEKVIEMGLNTSTRKLRSKFDELNDKKVVEKKIILNEQILKKIKKIQEGWGEFSELEIIESLLDEKIKELEYKAKSNRKTDDNKLTRYISKDVKNEIIIRSEHRCEHISHNGKRCEERRNLEFDHIQPFALNGNRSVENIRLLCRGHNQRRSIKTFGIRDYNVLKNSFD
jgi:hypothetical protein